MSIHEPTGIHWIEHGSGPAIVVLHGFQVDHRLVHRFVESVFEVRADFRRIYVDLPGHGKSSGHDITSADDVVGRISAFIDDLMGTEPYALVGNSFGGGIARALTSLAPSRILGMALIAPMIIADSARRALPEHRVLEADDVFLATIESGAARADFEEIAVRQTGKPGNSSPAMCSPAPCWETTTPSGASRPVTNFPRVRKAGSKRMTARSLLYSAGKIQWSDMPMRFRWRIPIRTQPSPCSTEPGTMFTTNSPS